jgi:outer membrane cobalamin receptor
LRGVTLALQRQHGDTNYSASYDYADPRTQPNDQRFVRVARHVMNLQARHQSGAVGWFTELKLSSQP